MAPPDPHEPPVSDSAHLGSEYSQQPVPAGANWPPPQWPPGSKVEAPAAAVASGFPATKREGASWILFAVGGFVVGQVAALILIEVVAAILGKTKEVGAIGNLATPPEWYVVSSLVGLWVGFFGAPWLASRASGTRRVFADFGVRFKWVDLSGIAIGIGGQILVAVMYAPFIKHLHNFNGPAQKLTGDSRGIGFLVIAIFTVVAAPFMEELFFRGLILRALTRLFSSAKVTPGRAQVVGLAAAIVLDGLIFGLAHAELEQLAGLAVFGAVLAFVALRTGRLGMNMVAHASFNLLAVIALELNRSGMIH